MLFWTPHFSVLDSTFFVLDSTFWLDSTLKIDPAASYPKIIDLYKSNYRPSSLKINTSTSHHMNQE